MKDKMQRSINDYALRGLRDTADRDYIHARMAYNAKLIPQFRWSSLHALEKYLKCIFVLARVEKPNKSIKHELKRPLDILQEEIDIKVSDGTHRHIKFLEENYANLRYFEVSWDIHDTEIEKLDHAVWNIRRYCNTAIYEHGKDTKPLYINYEKRSYLNEFLIRSDKNTAIPGGFIEQVLNNRLHPARKFLVWLNFYYSDVKRNKLKIPRYVIAENAPFYLHPEAINEIEKYVHIPNYIKNGYK